MITLLVAIVFTQASAISQERCNDFLFEVAQEEFIRESTKPTKLEKVIGEDAAFWIRSLGGSYECREYATKVLKEQDWSARRSLLWGTFHRDREISLRSKLLLDILICPLCGGNGQKTIVYSKDYKYTIDCKMCRGVGHAPYEKNIELTNDDLRIYFGIRIDD